MNPPSPSSKAGEPNRQADSVGPVHFVYSSLPKAVELHFGSSDAGKFLPLLAVGTNTLAGGSSYFRDPQWPHHPARFYRLRSP